MSSFKIKVLIGLSAVLFMHLPLVVFKTKMYCGQTENFHFIVHFILFSEISVPEFELPPVDDSDRKYFC